MQVRHYARRTMNSYVHWIRRFLRFHGMRHPRELGQGEINDFLTHLAAKEELSASSQNQGLGALLFLDCKLLARDTGSLEGVVRAEQPRRLPVVLTPQELHRVLQRPDGVPSLVAQVCFGNRSGLIEHLREVRILHRKDLQEGYGRGVLPADLARKYQNPNREMGWQWVFPQQQRWRSIATGEQGRHHLHPSVVQRAMKIAAREAGITKPATCHRLRHSFATHLLERGLGHPQIQELLGHNGIKTTMVYTQVLNRGTAGIISPADLL